MCHPKDEAKVPSASPFASVAQLVEQRTENPRVVGSIPTGGTNQTKPWKGTPFQATCECSSSGRAPPCQGGGSEFEPRHSLQTSIRSKESFAPYFIRCHSQVVRQSSAKAPRPSSNLGGTSTSSRTAYRSRRRFLFPSKRHRSLTPSLLLSKPQPLRWVAVWVAALRAAFYLRSYQNLHFLTH